MNITIEELVEKLPSIKLSNETLYKVADLTGVLQAEYEGKEIEASDCILTPYYVESGMRLELYAYELRIDIVAQKDFNKHLLDVTGRKTLADVPSDIAERQKFCYIEVLKGERLKVEEIQTYLNYLFHSQEVKEEVVSSFSECKSENLYFEIY